MKVNWLLIVIAILILCCAYYGYKKGIVRIVFSIGSLIIAIVLSSILSPYINHYVRYNTNIYAKIEEKCVDLISGSSEEEKESAGTSLSQQLVQGQEDDPKTQQTKEQAAGQQTQKTQEQGAGQQTQEQGDGQQTQQTQVQSILNQQELPASLKETIEKMSLSVGEQAQNAQQAVAGSIADMVLSAICFVVTLLIIRIILMVLSRVLNIITKLPVIHGVNQFAGLTFGLAEGLLIVWIFFVFLTCILQTEFGQKCVQMVLENQILTYLYDHNLLMMIFRL